MAPNKRARRVEPALSAIISTYLQAVLSKRGVLLIRDRRVVWLEADEMDRLTSEWLRMSDPAAVSGDDAGQT